ncbi:MarR family winged helix-turn-helix transcriptional regulator [Amycolatopsis sp. DG1A-15b]|uniref:MarR family winged helix-turn-helix transcriptional regulator n=1 Tax=Amycolatopsis sp. DG1A-15b TaxID=3052846 RepID=UPI00255B4475|nr:MarR family winged helix-turn-helix transcriptional regulator [Amycolatopsis sp. DG1A-15b]WIX85222.1 MarR family winged helix-turn-helix transcriptional regulator [Amycolatopsis sp. DG1A-15b]
MPEPDQRLFFLLQQAAHRLRVAADRRCLAAAGITTAQLGALFAVREGGLTQRDLAARLGQRESAVTAMVARLADAGLLGRSAHPREHRAVVLELTPAGEEALVRVAPEIEDFNTRLRAVLGEEGFRQTAEAVGRLASREW